MPGATMTAIAKVTPKNFFEIIRDYEAYTEFVENMVEAQVIKRGKKGCRARFVLKVIKEIEYTIDTVEDAPHSLTWSLVESNLLKVDNGSWSLRPIDRHTTQITYGLEIGLGLFVPQMLMDRLTKTMLPSTIHAFVRRAEDLYPHKPAAKKH